MESATVAEARMQQHVTFTTSTTGGLGAPTVTTPSQRKPPGRGGTRRLGVDELGHYTYKKTPSSTLMASLQLGLQHSIGSIEPKPHRDILMTDFEVVETVDFPAAGSDCTPAHKCKDFTFKTYCPEAMRFFREAFGILPQDFLIALCDRPLREVSNPGASGSLFYLSADDIFILKTVQKKEARFLQKLLPGYYLNLTQHKRTLLPKFFGLYRYKSGSINIRIVVMNNLLPSSILYHEKFDLKGSTYKRKASSAELKKGSPTFKDLDFMEKHEEGINLSPEKFEALLHSMDRDCKVLESFGIMDYSLLLGIHNIDQAIREKAEATKSDVPDGPVISSRIEFNKNFSVVSTEDIPSLVAAEQQQRHHYPEGYIQGRIQGDRVMFYLGIIDILQSYRLKKKLEHGIKSVITDGTAVSVHNPSFYSRRFQDFMKTQVFKKDKTKYRTRKNSTNMQLRGRRQKTERQNSHEIRTSPLQDPPSYNQAMKGSAVASKDSYIRSRSYSESVTMSKTGSPPITALKFIDNERIKSPPSSVELESGLQQTVETKYTFNLQGNSSFTDSQDTLKPDDQDVLAGRSEVTVEPLKLQDIDVEFGNGLRGTSTPIDVSPIPSPNQTHVYDIDLQSREDTRGKLNQPETVPEAGLNIETGSPVNKVRRGSAITDEKEVVAFQS